VDEGNCPVNECEETDPGGDDQVADKKNCSALSESQLALQTYPCYDCGESFSKWHELHAHYKQTGHKEDEDLDSGEEW